MLAKVLIAFLYAHDHHTNRMLEPGAIEEIDEGVFEGLEEEGFIGEASADEIEAAQSGPVVLPPPVEVPADWRAMSWFALRKLAMSLGAGAKVDKPTAIAVVEAHQAERA